MMQRASLSLLRSAAAAAPAQLEAGLGKALGSSAHLFSTASPPLGQQPASPALAGRTPALASLLLLRHAQRSSPQQQLRFAGNYRPEVPGNTVDNWTELRGAFGKERPNSLGGNYYANVLVMGFAYWLNDSYYFPARTLWVGALVFTLLYVRRSFFSTPLASQTEY